MFQFHWYPECAQVTRTKCTSREPMFGLTLHYLVLTKRTGSVEAGVMYLKDSVSTSEDLLVGIAFLAESH